MRSTPDFYKTDWIGNSTSSAVSVSTPDAHAVHLKNPDSGSSYYIVRQTNSSSKYVDILSNFNAFCSQTCRNQLEFRMNITTSRGMLQIPALDTNGVKLSGRQSKLIVTDYRFGSSLLAYSTTSVLYAGKIGERDVLFLHGDSRHQHEAAIFLKDAPSGAVGHPLVSFQSQSLGTEKLTLITFLPGAIGLIPILDTPKQLVLYADSDTAGTFWAPTLSGTGDFAQFWQHGTNDTVLVGGPYLVRGARLEKNGSHLALQGDLLQDVRLFLFAPPNVKTLSWNEAAVIPDVQASQAISVYGGVITATLRSRVESLTTSIVLPSLEGWKYANSLPEIQLDYSDENWTIADRKTTNIPYKPRWGEGPVLYSCDYGL